LGNRFEQDEQNRSFWPSWSLRSLAEQKGQVSSRDDVDELGMEAGEEIEGDREEATEIEGEPPGEEDTEDDAENDDDDEAEETNEEGGVGSSSSSSYSDLGEEGTGTKVPLGLQNNEICSILGTSLG